MSDVMKMRDKVNCPVCKNKLILRQINLHYAVYLCRDKQCSYPLGHNWIFESRTLEGMYRDNEKHPKKELAKTHYARPPSAVIQEEAFNINDLIENEINKIQNSTVCTDSFDINTDFLDGDNFGSLFENKDSEQSVYNSVECLNSSNVVNDSYIQNVLQNESTISNTDVYNDAIGFCDNFNSSSLSELLSNDTEIVNEPNHYLEKSEKQNYPENSVKTTESSPEVRAENTCAIPKVGNEMSDLENSNNIKNSLEDTEVINVLNNCYVEKCMKRNDPEDSVKDLNGSFKIIGDKVCPPKRTAKIGDFIGKLINSSQNRCADKIPSKSSKPIILNHYIFNKQY